MEGPVRACEQGNGGRERLRRASASSPGTAEPRRGPRSAGSAALPDRRATLNEGGCAFLGVQAVKDRRLQLILQRPYRGGGLDRRGPDQPLGHCHPERAVGRDSLRQRDGFVEHLHRIHQTVDQPELEGALAPGRGSSTSSTRNRSGGP